MTTPQTTVSVVVGPGHGSDRQRAEVSVVGRIVWLTFLGPRGGRQYTLPLDAAGAESLRRTLGLATGAILAHRQPPEEAVTRHHTDWSQMCHAPEEHDEWLSGQRACGCQP